MSRQGVNKEPWATVHLQARHLLVGCVHVDSTDGLVGPSLGDLFAESHPYIINYSSFFVASSSSASS